MPAPEKTVPRVLIVDDELEMAETVADWLNGRGFVAVATNSGRDAVTQLERGPFDALVTDMRMPSVDGLALLAASRRLAPERPVIVMTAYGGIDTAVESIRQGAYHYLTKPFKLDELVIFLRRALDDASVRREAATLKRTLRDRFAAATLLGESRSMRAVLDVMDRIADTNASVLILGETGTGKGLVARALHTESRRAAAPFVTVNCAALPEQLLESELFGHVKGAFTGATANRAGLFVEAHGGTLFLDEIGEMAPGLQAKLLHVLERGTVRPVGESKEREVDVRVLAATHRNVRERVATAQFREDLFYRLDVVSVELPPLRARMDDLPVLAEHFLRIARAKYPASPVTRLSSEVMARFAGYRFPGNVRELAHVIERGVLLGRGTDLVPEDLPLAVQTDSLATRMPFSGEIVPVRELQRRYAAWVLEQLGGNRTRAAERLGIDTKTLAKWVAEEQEDAERVEKSELLAPLTGSAGRRPPV